MKETITQATKQKYNADERIHPAEQARAFIMHQQTDQADPEARQTELSYLKDSRLIGQVFQTYLLLEHENRFIIIDQHAAHERIIYEQLHDQYMKNKNQLLNKQILLQNETLELTNMRWL